MEYGRTTTYGSSTPLDSALVTSHRVTLSGLSASTLYHYRVKSRDAAGNLAVSADFTFATLAPPLAIATTSLPMGTVGVSYSATLLASGGVAPYSWSIVSGALPPGLALGASTGAITGTPSASGQYSFTVQVKDSAASPQTATKAFTISIAAAPTAATSTSGIWVSAAGLASRLMSGPAWDNLKSTADNSCGPPDLSNQDETANTCTLAKALVFARTNDENYRRQVMALLEAVVGTECASPGNIACPDGVGGRSLAVGRKVAAYVASADLINLPKYNPTFDTNTFRPWLKHVLNRVNSEGKSLKECNEIRPNNWGVTCGMSRAAVDIYLGDLADLDRTATVFKGWVGDRAAYAGFSYGDLSWQADPTKPVGINPPGSTIQGHSVDGVLPDDQRRCGSFAWPPCKTNYEWTALQGAIPQAVILSRAGYDVWNWQDKALLRAVTWLHVTTFSDGTNYPAEGNDTWLPHLVNFFYASSGSSFPAPVPPSPGKTFAWTDWTHGSGAAPPADTTPPMVSITSPASGATVSGTITISADASDNAGVAGVQFKVDGNNLGAEDTSAPYSVSWSTTLVANGSHTLTAVARDAAGNRTTSAGITVTVSNSSVTDVTPPVISGVAASSFTAFGAVVSWTTNEASDSQVDYGTSTAYGSSTPLDSALVTSHRVTLSGLSASTLYHYRVKSRDAAGNLAVSADFTFATLAPPLAIATTSLPMGTVGVSYSATLLASGGVPPYSWLLFGGQLPTNLSLSSGGVISGVPTVAGLFTFTVEVRDAAGGSASSAFTITIVSPPPPGGETAPNFKVAFIGDQGSNSNSKAVLQLIKGEGAQMVLHQGDFDYSDNHDVWDQQINDILGSDFPYFASVGNHDVAAWPGYQAKLQARLDRIVGASCVGDLGVQSACHYQGLFFLLTAPGTMGSGHDTYIRDQLAADNSIWSVCSWHKDQTAMQVGSKANETGWGVYEECRKGGGIIATAHEHSYERTRTLVDTVNQIVDPSAPSATELRVVPGATFVFVSGLGGQSIRNQDRCLPTTFPYGCKGEWANIFTSDQNANYGALFIIFNVDGDPKNARGYFKTIDSRTVDTFTITTP